MKASRSVRPFSSVLSFSVSSCRSVIVPSSSEPSCSTCSWDRSHTTSGEKLFVVVSDKKLCKIFFLEGGGEGGRERLTRQVGIG